MPRLLLAALAIALLAPACGEDGEIPVPSDIGVGTLDVTMINDPANADPIHILGPQEGFNDTNRLEPGQERMTVVRRDLLPDVTGAEFRAGRNGAVLVTRVCRLSVLGGENVVRWEEGALFCEGGFSPL